MKKSEFLKEVYNELVHIKANATKEELDRLDFPTFFHHKRDSCIYGQMTGKCSSIRAKELYNKTYKLIYKDSPSTKANYCSFSSQSKARGNEFTALEKYLYMVDDDVHEEIINFLKGVTDKIILK